LQTFLERDIPQLGVQIPAAALMRMDAPMLTPSMQIALRDLKLDRLIVVYPGERRYRLAERVEVVPLTELVGTPSASKDVFKKRR
jgi:hypothetical protein